MKVKNVGGKIVSIGVTAILPGETAQVSDSYAKNPAVKCLIEHGNLSIVKETTAEDKAKKAAEKKAAEEKAKAEAEAKAKAEADAKAKAEAEKKAAGGEA